MQVEPKFAVDYQMIVIECLDDPDETLKRKVYMYMCYNEGIMHI